MHKQLTYRQYNSATNRSLPSSPNSLLYLMSNLIAVMVKKANAVTCSANPLMSMYDPI